MVKPGPPGGGRQRLAQSGAGGSLELVARKKAKLKTTQKDKIQQARNAAQREMDLVHEARKLEDEAKQSQELCVFLGRVI